MKPTDTSTVLLAITADKFTLYQELDALILPFLLNETSKINPSSNNSTLHGQCQLA
ncbi:hypothetical protein [Rubritalea tangerina]|uniref:hypothetical protein n=1 Tax=Rubritalea tangerina TaxID=430798 RepID=UPI00361A31FE